MKYYNVTNRSGSRVIYSIPEMNNLRREFEVGETKKISEDELHNLSVRPGGINILAHYLLIRERKGIEEVGLQPEPEYFMTEKEIKNLLETGSLDQFLDCLDFAPQGVIEIIKDMSVKLPLNDVAKRKALFDKTGFNVDNAIANEEAMKTDAEKQNNAQNKRRVPVSEPAASETPARRTAYKITPVTKD